MPVSEILHAGGRYETQPLPSAPSIDREAGRWGAVLYGENGEGDFGGGMRCRIGAWRHIILIRRIWSQCYQPHIWNRSEPQRQDAGPKAGAYKYGFLIFVDFPARKAVTIFRHGG